MEAPKCRLCGEREWNHVCNGLSSKGAKNVSIKTARRIAASERTCARCVELEAEVRQLKRLLAERVNESANTPANTPPVNTPAANKQSRAEYMRDYMRQRRKARLERQDTKPKAPRNGDGAEGKVRS